MKTLTTLLLFISPLLNGQSLTMKKGKLNAGYSCASLSSARHGANVSYVTRTGFEVGYESFALQSRLERTELTRRNNVYLKFRLLNLWEGSNLFTKMTYHRGEIVKSVRQEEFTCQAGLEQRIGKGILIFGNLVECRGNYGYGVGISKLF